ncbi:hypothetical protein AHAS_Ahas17G0150600 [Arachis hypogaea]
MSIQAKVEPGSPPIVSSTSNKSLETMSIPELIQILPFQLQSLATIDAEDKLKKKEQQYKKVQELYETSFKGVKKSGLDKRTIENLRKKNKKLQCENLKLLELKKKYEVDGNAFELNDKNEN